MYNLIIRKIYLTWNPSFWQLHRITEVSVYRFIVFFSLSPTSASVKEFSDKILIKTNCKKKIMLSWRRFPFRQNPKVTRWFKTKLFLWYSIKFNIHFKEQSLIKLNLNEYIQAYLLALKVLKDMFGMLYRFFLTRQFIFFCSQLLNI